MANAVHPRGWARLELETAVCCGPHSPSLKKALARRQWHPASGVDAGVGAFIAAREIHRPGQLLPAVLHLVRDELSSRPSGRR